MRWASLHTGHGGTSHRYSDYRTHFAALFEAVGLPLYRAKRAGTLTMLLAHYMRTSMFVACADAALGAGRKWSYVARALDDAF